MATLQEYFFKDFNYVLGAHRSVRVQSSDGVSSLEIIVRVHLDFNANVRYLSCYVPDHENTYEVCTAIVKDRSLPFAMDKQVLVQSGYLGENLTHAKDMPFSGRMFIYHEGDVPADKAQRLCALAGENAISLILRSKKFVQDRVKVEKPLAFICHDWHDKDDVARPLAVQLSKMICPVWFDEFSLKVGDSLRESIEKGIKTCQKCIIILSPDFLSNEGWTKAEFNAVISKEIIEKASVILPVWRAVDKQRVFDYSPILVDKVAVKWDGDVERVAKKLYRSIVV